MSGVMTCPHCGGLHSGAKCKGRELTDYELTALDGITKCEEAIGHIEALVAHIKYLGKKKEEKYEKS